MSENDKNEKGFEFIKEHIVEKKRKKYKKWLISLCKTVIMAILFGLIAAVTFCIAEPMLYQRRHKQEESKTPIRFPQEEGETPGEKNDVENKEEIGTVKPDLNTTPNSNNEGVDSIKEDPEPIIVEKVIEADIDDYINIYSEIRKVAYDTNRALVRVASKFNSRDWFNNPIEKNIVTTGLVIANDNSDLLILVSLDRVLDASSIKIELTETIAIDAILLDYDSEINLAIIAVSLAEIPTMFLDSITVAKLGESYTIVVGNPVIALGNPNGYPQSMDVGIITSKGSSISVIDNKLDLFNTNIVDNPNSDGVIVNLKGEIIGIITRKLKEGMNKDINTVLGISRLKPIIERMVNQTSRVYFGVKTGDMTELTKASHNISNGIYVNEVMENSPAFQAGLKTSDIIMLIEDKEVKSTIDFYKIISTYQPGTDINVKIKRTAPTSDKEMILRVKLAEKEQQ